MTLLLGLLAIVALIGMSVLISLSEISFAAAREVRLRARAEAGDARATRFLQLRRNGGQVVTVLQICLNAVGVLGGIASDGLLAPPLSATLHGLGVPAAASAHLGAAGGFCLVTGLFVLFADLLPKRIAMRAPDRVALRSAGSRCWRCACCSRWSGCSAGSPMRSCACSASLS